MSILRSVDFLSVAYYCYRSTFFCFIMLHSLFKFYVKCLIHVYKSGCNETRGSFLPPKSQMEMVTCLTARSRGRKIPMQKPCESICNIVEFCNLKGTKENKNLVDGFLFFLCTIFLFPISKGVLYLFLSFLYFLHLTCD